MTFVTPLFYFGQRRLRDYEPSETAKPRDPATHQRYNHPVLTKRAWVALVLLALSAGTASALEQGTSRPRDRATQRLSSPATQQPFDLRLIEPADHAEVVAGSTVPIVWDAGKVPAGVEEWEAFLSVDGGKTYPVRITPHLDAGIHRFNWIVPSLPGADVSILLRFGDEREEVEFPFAGRMHITGRVSREAFRGTTSIRRATEDDHGRTLTEWVEGSRQGLGLRHVVVDDSWLVGDREWKSDRDHDSMPAIGAASKRVDGSMCVSRVRGDGVAGSEREERRPLPTHVAGVLLLTGRLNI